MLSAYIQSVTDKELQFMFISNFRIEIDVENDCIPLNIWVLYGYWCLSQQSLGETLDGSQSQDNTEKTRETNHPHSHTHSHLRAI